jgi:hypothetical protein
MIVRWEAGLREQWPKAYQGGLSGSSLLRSDGAHDSHAGRLDCVSSGQRQTKGTTGVKFTQIRWFLGSQAGEVGLHEQWPKDTQGKSKP